MWNGLVMCVTWYGSSQQRIKFTVTPAASNDANIVSAIVDILLNSNRVEFMYMNVTWTNCERKKEIRRRDGLDRIMEDCQISQSWSKIGVEQSLSKKEIDTFRGNLGKFYIFDWKKRKESVKLNAFNADQWQLFIWEKRYEISLILRLIKIFLLLNQCKAHGNLNIQSLDII